MRLLARVTEEPRIPPESADRCPLLAWATARTAPNNTPERRGPMRPARKCAGGRKHRMQVDSGVGSAVVSAQAHGGAYRRKSDMRILECDEEVVGGDFHQRAAVLLGDRHTDGLESHHNHAAGDVSPRVRNGNVDTEVCHGTAQYGSRMWMTTERRDATLRAAAAAVHLHNLDQREEVEDPLLLADPREPGCGVDAPSVTVTKQ